MRDSEALHFIPSVLSYLHLFLIFYWFYCDLFVWSLWISVIKSKVAYRFNQLLINIEAHKHRAHCFYVYFLAVLSGYEKRNIILKKLLSFFSIFLGVSLIYLFSFLYKQFVNIYKHNSLARQTKLKQMSYLQSKFCSRSWPFIRWAIVVTSYSEIQACSKSILITIPRQVSAIL